MECSFIYCFNLRNMYLKLYLDTRNQGLRDNSKLYVKNYFTSCVAVGSV